MLLLITSVFLFKTSHAQNLIQNGSFEAYTNPIDCSAGGFDNNSVGIPVPHVLDNWFTFNSPDYFTSICGAGGYSVPYSYFGNCYAKEGNSFVGEYIYKNGSENKEYIYQQLSSPLQSGKMYCLSFYVSRTDRIPFAVKNMGVYFSNTLPSLIGGEYINAIPQVENQNSFLTDTTGWIQIQGCFTAMGGEQFVTIGNFHNNANTDTLRIQSTNPLTGTGTDVAYYYIDDVSLIDQTTVTINELNIFSTINLFPNPNNGEMTLVYDLANNSKAEIELLNITGKVISKRSIDNSMGSLTFKEQDLSNGVYLYRIVDGGAILKTGKIVIIK